MEKQNNVPKLRFPEFSDGWEVKKLGEVAEIGRGKSKHRPRDADFLFGGKYPFIQTGDVRKAELYLTEFTQTYSEAGLKQSKLWDENTLCITIAANIAETAILKIKACFPDSIIGLIPKENETIVLFVKHLFDKFKIQIQSLSQGAAQDNLNQEKLSNIEFIFPTLPEQQKIATFLSTVDEKLQALKKKKSLLETYKKGVMQKLFSQEIRFKDDEGNDFEDWEVKRLGEVTTYVDYRGKAPIKTEEGRFLVTAKNIKKGFIDYECSKEYVGENDYANVMSKGLPAVGDILFTTEAPMGNVAQVDISDIALAQRVIKFRAKKVLSNLYLLHYMLSDIFQKAISGKAIGTTVQGISGKELHQIKISFPPLSEQTKIANFLTAIDEKITKVDAQIKQTELWKKGLLQQMFV